MLRIGILGCGNIAGTLAGTMVRMPETLRIEACASRDKAKAEEFASRFDIPKAYGSYEELYEDSDIDLIYIATPHSHHKQQMIAALEHGRNVLSEKAFTVNEKEAKEVFDLAKEKGLFAGEAIWTRYMPSRRIIDGIISSGRIGRVVSISANLGYKILHKERIHDPHLAGGALLDVGIYPLNFVLMAAGNDTVKSLTGLAVEAGGVDVRSSASLLFSSGIAASIYSDSETNTDKKGIIYGTEGVIEVSNVNNPEEIRIYSGDRSPELLETIPVTHEINGYEYELKEAVECIASGRLEPESMPWSETLRVLRIMDSLRGIWGIKLASELE